MVRYGIRDGTVRYTVYNTVRCTYYYYTTTIMVETLNLHKFIVCGYHIYDIEGYVALIFYTPTPSIYL